MSGGTLIMPWYEDTLCDMNERNKNLLAYN